MELCGSAFIPPTPLVRQDGKIETSARSFLQVTAPKYIHLLSIPLERKYTSASVFITSGRTAGIHFPQTPIRKPPKMLISLHLLTQNGVPVNVFSLMGTDKSLMRLNLVNRGGG
ncbi:hypothetical protein TNCV_934131 [Trichonephila clavipes]|nr:hypothetical protein TNCV_934131 [Trichonephila clavipes]